MHHILSRLPLPPPSSNAENPGTKKNPRCITASPLPCFPSHPFHILFFFFNYIFSKKNTSFTRYIFTPSVLVAFCSLFSFFFIVLSCCALAWCESSRLSSSHGTRGSTVPSIRRSAGIRALAAPVVFTVSLTGPLGISESVQQALHEDLVIYRVLVPVGLFDGLQHPVVWAILEEVVCV